MFVDFKLFQRQDRAIYEALDDGPSTLGSMALMPADRGAALWIRRWRELCDTGSPVAESEAQPESEPSSGAADRLVLSVTGQDARTRSCP